MQALNEQQLASLRKLGDLARVATLELDDSFSTGRMSDSKSAVYAVMTAADELDLPDELALQLRQIAHESWHGAASSGGPDVYSRAARAIGAIGKLERLIASVFEANGLPEGGG